MQPRALPTTLATLLAAAALLAACDAAPDPAVALPATPDGPAQLPRLRLPRDVVPISNRVRLVVDPSRETFSGRIEIAARVDAPTRLLWLNAQDLEVSSAVASDGGSHSWSLEVLAQEADFVGLRAPVELPAGPLQIALEYTGKIDGTETLGIFRQQEDGRWYAFTQFEPLAARRAFPCFDEPDRKLPWQLTLEVPADLVAVSNTAVVSEQTTARGTRIVAFRETPPLPSYLVAFGVGPFDVVDAGASRSGMPIRAIVPRGRAGDVRYAAEVTAPILALVEDYFGTPHPFEKLDLLAIPLTAGFGAMENVGLITFSSRLLLARPEDLTIRYRRSYAEVLAHELAHQWFGNQVTLAWWDDLWLNEAFATWLEGKVIGAWKPEWDSGVGPVQLRERAMGSDALHSARKIREPIESADDVFSAFDGITYSKGASVIQMFERFVGPDAFRAGVRAYLARHAGGNATAAQFLAAISEAAGRDVAAPFSTFLDQVGTPLVRFELSCAADRPARLALAQERYVPLGSAADRGERWQVPICVKYRAGGEIAEACTLLTEASGELALPGVGCPDWLLPNDDVSGYYRSALAGELLEPLLARGMDELELPERVGVLGDVRALMAAGQLEPGAALGVVPRYAAEPSRHLVAAAANIASDVREYVGDDVRERYARFVRDHFGARARSLGWTPAAGEDEDVRLLRSQLLGLVTREGEDAELAAGARPLALAWLADHASVAPDLADLAVDTAARYGDAALFERFQSEATRATNRRDRARLLDALATFRQPELIARALELSLASEFDPREATALVFAGAEQRSTRALGYAFVKKHYDDLASRLPEEMAAMLVYPATGQCDAAVRRDVEAFFEGRMREVPGGPRTYAQAIEEMDLCIAQREALAPGIAAFLTRS